MYVMDASVKLMELIGAHPALGELEKTWSVAPTIKLESAAGSSFALVAAAMAVRRGGVHVFVMEDKDRAAYLANDLYAVLDNERVLFFPTAYKRSVQFGQQDPSGIIQRTTALNAIKNHSEGYLAICTYPEAMVEKVVDMEELRQNTLSVNVGEKLSIAFIEQALAEYGFDRVDFVHEPGQYSVRGGIVDVFSFSENRPFRLDFFGDEVDSIRHFDLASQLSVDRMQTVEIVPNLKNMEIASHRVSFARFVGEATYWMDDPDHALKRFNDIRAKILNDLEDPTQIDSMVTSRRGFIADTEGMKMVELSDNLRERAADATVAFGAAPQPRFNKNFDLLAQDIEANQSAGFTTYILSENKAQIERLENIFHSVGHKNLRFEPLGVTIHGGFVCRPLKICVYTDHEIFERYHRYRLRNELDRSESLTVAELNALKVGDYVVHIDHGVGRFGGLVRTVENGKVQEAIKLVYRDNDVLFVNVHALHRIARYKDRDSEAPRIHKLGSGLWQKMKATVKKAVKDIGRELIALYARRKSSQGFAFSHDTYMQTELEASFIYEDTPDQVKATKAVKADMESPQPMDRLVCGDVGFGKTEIAIRAAFKAAADGKQVAVLVPTTILALQHYRTFTQRLRDFPVRIEMLSRVRSAKETRQILEALEAGKVDILIGTHKILGKDVRFRDLGLLIIDEEQKFGVGAKEKLRQMSVSVDTLTLSATPIPRTLQFSLMGSRDMSVISTPPPNRQPIATESHLFDTEIIREAIEYELSRHGQVYFIHNNVQQLPHIASIIQDLVPQVRVGIGHGQMPAAELERVIMDFIYGEFDVLVSTTIVENGVDIANANTIIINNAQNFGLSDMHQMRGRVGRSDKKGFCYLLTPPDETLTDESRRRLRALEEFSELGSGFNIAMQDLDIRGAGNLLGAEQSGFIADIGFETYQKILTEAMDELRAEGLVTGGQSDAESAGESTEETIYLHDAHIETDLEAYIPDEYVGQSVEKIRLYKELDSLTEEEQLKRFEAELEDRFGPVPQAVKELLDVIRLRRLAMKLGFERVKVKNGLMIVRFIENSESPYYKSSTFMGILKTVTRDENKFVLKQNNNKLALTVRKVKDIGDAVRTLQKMLEQAQESLSGGDAIN